MLCPACNRKIADEGVWFCPHCDHVINLSFLGEDTGANDMTALLDNQTLDSVDALDVAPDAVILGDLSLGEGDETAVISAVRRDSDGRIAPALLYASGNTSRIVHPDAILELGERDVTVPNTPIENFVLSCVNGRRTLREIQRASGFKLAEVVGAVLTLIEKRVVRIRQNEDGTPAINTPPDENEFAEEIHTERTRSPLAKNDRPKIIEPEHMPLQGEDTVSEMDGINADDLEHTDGFEPLTELPPDAFDEVGDWDRDEVSSSVPAITDDSAPAKPPAAKLPPPSAAPAAIDAPLLEGFDDASQPSVPAPPLRPQVSDLTIDRPRPPARAPSAPKGAPQILKTEYLIELQAPSVIPDSARAPIGVSEPKPLEIRPASIAKPAKPAKPPEPAEPAQSGLPAAKRPVSIRAPVMERSRSEAKERERAPEPEKKPTSSPVVRKLDPENDRAYRARKLFDEAMKDKDKGDFLSAQMNVKLAMSFDSNNPEYKRALEDLGKLVQTEGARRGPAKRSQATELAEQATAAETGGDVDGAIKLLEKALKQSKDAATYNRLGVILATKKRDINRGREMIEKALELAPNNETYQHNLSKILARAAEVDLVRSSKRSEGGGGGGKKGLLGLFGKKK